MAVDPPMSYPARVWPGWKVPTTVYPDVSVTVPAVIAFDPDVPRTRAHGPGFDNSRGRTDPNNHFSAHSPGAQQQSEG